MVIAVAIHLLPFPKSILHPFLSWPCRQYHLGPIDLWFLVAFHQWEAMQEIQGRSRERPEYFFPHLCFSTAVLWGAASLHGDRCSPGTPIPSVHPGSRNISESWWLSLGGLTLPIGLLKDVQASVKGPFTTFPPESHQNMLSVFCRLLTTTMMASSGRNGLCSRQSQNLTLWFCYFDWCFMTS